MTLNLYSKRAYGPLLFFYGAFVGWKLLVLLCSTEERKSNCFRTTLRENKLWLNFHCLWTVPLKKLAVESLNQHPRGNFHQPITVQYFQRGHKSVICSGMVDCLWFMCVCLCVYSIIYMCIYPGVPLNVRAAQFSEHIYISSMVYVPSLMPLTPHSTSPYVTINSTVMFNQEICSCIHFLHYMKSKLHFILTVPFRHSVDYTYV